MRPRRLILVWTVCASLSALGDPRPGELIGDDSDLGLQSGEGHVVIVFDLLDDLEQLRFTGPGEWLTKFKLQGISSGISAIALRMPVGLYCLDTFYVSDTRYRRKDDDDLGLCFRVADGALSYTGHMTVRATGDKSRRGSTTSWLFKPDQFLARMQRQYPLLLERHGDLRFAAATGNDPVRPITTFDFAITAFEIGDSVLGTRLLEAAGRTGSTDAMLELGARYFEGNGVGEDRARALSLLDMAVKAGDMRGAAMSCLVYQDPAYEGAKLAIARAYCEQAAVAGDARSMVQLAAFVRDGKGGATADRARAFRLVSAAAEKGDAEGQFQTGVALRDGVGVAPDLAAAIGWFERAITKNNPDAAHAMARLLETGHGVVPDPGRAFELYELAARGSHVEGTIALAAAYANGRGVARDLARADELLRGISRRSPEGAFAYAWFLVTCPDPAFRDGGLARRLAQGALYSRATKLPADYAIVAATLADAGDFIGAKRDVKRAIERQAKLMPADDPQLKAWRAQLASYEREQPWREP